MEKETSGGTFPANLTRGQMARHCESPVALSFFMSSNQNSPQFHFRFDNCSNVTIDTICMSSPALSPNTDGIHVENTELIGIYNGDDCVSIGAGNVSINIVNVTCGPSHGISIGSLGKQNTRAYVANVTVRNAVIRHSDNGVRIKTWQGGSGSVSSISFHNIRMDTMMYPTPASGERTYDVRSPPIYFGCSDSVPCTNITLSEVELLPAQVDFISDPFCWNAYGATETLTIPPLSCLSEGLPQSIMDIDSDKCYRGS
ncbi:hypothetical protein OPV22_026304 [Ensete ventricosum]|uniref:Polygalacturonase n=1 Tax=Ensete ventricosum TaxID=4639 RepID=A0AAV8P8D5_ENSVE|nr:hypothetical protein OPV22_026304 [Ensete ventricosum]